MPSHQTITTVLRESKSVLTNSDSADLDARVLMCFLLAVEYTYLITHADVDLTNKQIAAFWRLIEKRNSGIPVAYLIEQKEFWSLRLKVNRHVLIPRPETELLVEKVLSFVKHIPIPSILDLGTGSGAIALALASELPDANLVAVDCSEQALSLAAENARNLNIINTSFLKSDWFQKVPTREFDVICSNPPYIDEQDKHLNQDGLLFEPRSALVSKTKGLADIQKIIESALDYLRPKGLLILEHGYNQAENVRDMFIEQGYKNIQTDQDFSGINRATSAIKS